MIHKLSAYELNMCVGGDKEMKCVEPSLSADEYMKNLIFSFLLGFSQGFAAAYSIPLNQGYEEKFNGGRNKYNLTIRAWIGIIGGGSMGLLCLGSEIAYLSLSERDS